MDFSVLNYWGVLAAAVASFVFGALYYLTFGKQWMEALGKSKEELKSAQPPFVFGISFLLQLLMAFVLAGILYHMGNVTPRAGVISGAFVWLGFVATTMITNQFYEGAKRMQTVIDGVHWLAVLVIQGLVLGLFGG